jgi:hypothetical protein
MTEPAPNEWERAYQASVEAAYRAHLQAEAAHEREMATMPRGDRRSRVVVFAVMVLACGSLLLIPLAIDGMASYDVVSGHAVKGTAVLTRLVEVCVGRPPCSKSWEARFFSDDGTVQRLVVFAEDVPGSLAHVGARVPARWTSVKPDSVYLAASSAFRIWLWASIVVFALMLLGAWVTLATWRRRRRLRRQIEAAQAAAAAIDRPPTG